MRFAPPLVEGRLIERPNRFLGLVDLDGTVVKTWIHDPGRLSELLFPGARVWVAPAAPGRKTTHTAMLTRNGRSFVSLYSSLPNQLVAESGCHFTPRNVPKLDRRISGGMAAH